MSLKNQVFLTFSVLLIIPIIMFAIVVQLYLSNTKKVQLQEASETMLVQLANNMDLIVEDAAKSTMSILFNNQQLVYLRKYANQSSKLKLRMDESEITNYLSSLVYDKKHIEGISIISENGHIFSSMSDTKVKDYYELDNLAYYEKAKDKQGKWFLIFDQDISYYNGKQENSLSLIRLIRDPLNSNELGIVKVDFNSEYISKMIEPIMSGEFMIKTLEGEVLMQSEKISNFNKCEQKTNLDEAMCIQMVSDHSKMIFEYILPEDYYVSKLEDIKSWVVIYVIFSLFLSFVITYFVVKRLLKPLTQLKNHISSFQTTIIHSNVEDNSGNEIDNIRIAYDGLIFEIERLVHEMYDTTKKNLEMEFKVLQSQMEPHFLFNTLEMINMKALVSRDFELSDMIVQLAKCIRYHIKDKDSIITLKDEIDFAKSYLAIMELRLGKRLKVEWQIQAMDDALPVPKYLIQPLIENAIIHGMFDSEQQLSIFIHVYHDDEKIIVKVKDNGKGINKNKLLQIQKMLHGEDNIQFGIALQNISKLIKYGRNELNTMEIKSDENKGTEVKITIYMEESHEKSNDR